MQLALLGEGVTPSLVFNSPGGINPASLGVLPLPDNFLGSAGEGVRDALNVPQEGPTKNKGNKTQPPQPSGEQPVLSVYPPHVEIASAGC